MSQSDLIAAQAWYWSINSVIVEGKKVLNDEAKDTFLRIYKGQVPEDMTTIECDYVFSFLSSDSGRLLSEDILLREIPTITNFINVWSLINNITDEEKKNELCEKISNYSPQQITLISKICMGEKEYKPNDIVDFIIKNICTISTKTGIDQENDAINFCELISELAGSKFVFQKKNNIRKSFSQYRNAQVLISHPESYAGPSRNIKDFIMSEMEKSNFLWALAALQDLKVKSYNIDLDLNDILDFFKKYRDFVLEENCVSVLVKVVLASIKANPGKYFLGEEIYNYFDNLYDLDEALKDLSPDNFDFTRFKKIKKHEFLRTLPTDLVNRIKSLNEKDIYLIEDIINSETAGEFVNRLEILINVKSDNIIEFTDIVNEMYPNFFSRSDLENYDFYNHTISENLNGDIYEYLEKNLTARNLSSVLRALKVSSLVAKNKVDFSKILFLISRKNIITLFPNELEVELRVIANSPNSYYFGQQFINYFIKTYGFDANDENVTLDSKIYNNRDKNNIIYSTNYEDDGIDLVSLVVNDYKKTNDVVVGFKHTMTEAIVFVLNYTYTDVDTNVSYKLKPEDEKKAIKKIMTEHNLTIPDNFDEEYKELKVYKRKDIDDAIKSAESFKDVLYILKVYKQLNHDNVTLNQDILEEWDEYFESKQFYTKHNYLSLLAFYNKLSSEGHKYAYASELCSFYNDRVKQIKNRTDEFDKEPLIERVNTKSNEDTLGYKIINRVMPLEKTEKKKALTAIISGIGVISFLLMTVVLAKNPIEAIEQCSTSFKGLFTNLSLSNIKNVIGNPVLYFASIYESARLFTKKRFKAAKDYIQEEMNRSK